MRLTEVITIGRRNAGEGSRCDRRCECTTFVSIPSQGSRTRRHEAGDRYARAQGARDPGGDRCQELVRRGPARGALTSLNW